MDPATCELPIQIVSVSGSSLLELIAQRPPMVMIDQLTRVNDQFAESLFRITPETVFSSQNRFSEAGLIENMAQTIAAGSGYCRQQTGKNIHRGFITMVKNLQVSRLPEYGAEICTVIRLDNNALGFRIFNTRVFIENSQIAECEIRIYIPGNQEE
ncbi:hypothetical protein KKI24_30430 [bacterium]|nr:hypothetical protein [bacterium]